MQTDSFEFFKKLVETPSPAGYEQPAAAVWREEAAKYADTVTADVLGNSVATLNPSGTPRILLASHIDEIGFMVKSIDDNGYIFMDGIGGHDSMVVVGQRVEIHTDQGTVYGVIGRKAWHLLTDEDSKKPELTSMWIDIGAENKAEAESLVKIGDPITTAAGMHLLGKKYVTSRALDNKMGAFILIELLKRLKGKSFSPAVLTAATTQEEACWRGAKVCAYGLNPQIAIAIDVGQASDHPDIDKKKTGDFKLGSGPMITRGPNANPCVNKVLFQAAKEKNIPFQIEAVPEGTGTDVETMQMAQAGVATGIISVPLRYMHTPNEVLALDDLEKTVDLLEAFIEAVQPDMNWIP